MWSSSPPSPMIGKTTLNFSSYHLVSHATLVNICFSDSRRSNMHSTIYCLFHILQQLLSKTSSIISFITNFKIITCRFKKEKAHTNILCNTWHSFKRFVTITVCKIALDCYKYSVVFNFIFCNTGSSSLGKFLGALDSTYNSMFQDATWKDTFEKSENQRSGNVYFYHPPTKLREGIVFNRVCLELRCNVTITHDALDPPEMGPHCAGTSPNPSPASDI